MKMFLIIGSAIFGMFLYIIVMFKYHVAHFTCFKLRFLQCFELFSFVLETTLDWQRVGI